MNSRRWFPPTVLALLPALAEAADFEVGIDTSPLAGRSGYRALDLVAGSPVAVNDVLVGSFASTSTLDAATTLDNVSGSLPGTQALRSSVFFSELLQATSTRP